MSFKRQMLSERNAFSLLELMVVLAIIVTIAIFAVPAIGPLMKGSQLTQGALMVSDQLNLARQTALSKNHAVEVRFYQFALAENPGERADNPATGHYRAVQLFEVRESGALVPVGKMARLAGSTIIDSGATLSSLIGAARIPPSSPALASGAELGVSLPQVGTHYNCASFRFFPGGTTNLTPKNPPSQWFLTLHALSDGDALVSRPPANFFTIQIDAINGHTKNFCP